MEPEAVSLLSKLEPVLGITFALNLAYIGLPRFRYRQAIRDHVRQKMTDMGDLPENHCETSWYKQIVRLGSLGNNDGQSDHDKEGKKAKRERLPDGFWAGLYALVYEWHIDRFVVMAFCVVCAAMLFLGVAHELSIWKWAEFMFGPEWIAYWLLLVVLMAIAPPLLVLGGGIVVGGAVRFVTNTIANIKLTLKSNAQEARLDATPSAKAPAIVRRAPVAVGSRPPRSPVG